MQGIIWYYGKGHRQAAIDKLKSILHNYELHTNIKVVKQSYSINSSYIIFNNGDTWSICPATQSSRGYKCNISLVDYSTPLEFVNTIIRPSTISYPYNALDYWYAE